MPWDSYWVLHPPPESKWQIAFLLCSFFITSEMQDVVCGLLSDHTVPPKISKTCSWHSEGAKSNMILMYSRTFLPSKWSLILSWDCTLLMSKRIGDALFKLLKYIVREEERMRGRGQRWKSREGVLRGKWVQLPRIYWLHFGDQFEFGLVGFFFDVSLGFAVEEGKSKFKLWSETWQV